MSFRLISPIRPCRGPPMGSWFHFRVLMKRARRRILQVIWTRARYAKLEKSQAFAYHSSSQAEVDRSLGTDASTMPTSEDMMPPLLVLPPEPIVVHHQTTTCGWGTRSHPYFIGDHFGYTCQVLEGVGCHRRDHGYRIIAGGFPKGHPSDVGDSNASSSACGRRHSGVVRAQPPNFPRYTGTRGVGYRSSLEA